MGPFISLPAVVLSHTEHQPLLEPSFCFEVPMLSGDELSRPPHSRHFCIYPSQPDSWRAPSYAGFQSLQVGV